MGPPVHPSLEKLETSACGEEHTAASLSQASLGVGSCPSPPQPSGPGSGCPPHLAGSRLLAVSSRSGADSSPPKPPPLLVPLQVFHKSSPRPPRPPQPTAHKSLSHRTLPVPFMSPLWGTSPSSAADSCLSDSPSSIAVLQPVAPLRGVKGHFKGERTALPPSPSPEWGLSQAINAQASSTIVLISFPEQVGPTPSPLPARLGAFFLLSLDV